MRRTAAIVLGSLVAASLIAAPATGAEESIALDCFGGAPDETWIDLYAVVTDDGGDYTGPATLAYTSTPADASSWTTETVDVEGGALYVEFEDWFAGDVMESFTATLSVGGATKNCIVDFAPALIDYSGTTAVAAGSTIRVLADLFLSDDLYFADTMPDVSLQVSTASGWKTVATARATLYGNYALLDYKPVGWANARLQAVAGGKVVGQSETFLIDVTYSKATLTSKSSAVVQSKSATATARVGGHATSGKASLQRKSGSKWVTVKSASFTGGTATFTWTQKSTTTYRIVMTPAGKSAAGTSSFTVKHVAAVSASPSKTFASSGTKVAVTATHRLATSGTGKLQYYSAGAWRTYKTFALSSTGTTKTSLTVTSTRKWRVLVGAYGSASFTVTKR